MFEIITKKSNIYFFYLYNLALADVKHWSRKDYNELFLITTGGALAEDEKRLLIQFQQVILKLEKQEKPIHLADFFYSTNQHSTPWLKLKKVINRSDYEIIFNTFKKFEKRFDEFWMKKLREENKTIQNNLAKNIKLNENRLKEIIKKLNILYGANQSLDNISKTPLFLIPLPEEITGGGGKFIPPLKAVVIECSNKRASKARTLEIIIHELVHLFFEKEHIKELFILAEQNLAQEKSKELIKPLDIPSVVFGLKEIIATSLTIKYRQDEQPVSSFSRLLIFTSRKLQPEIDSYFVKEKMIDEEFIKKTLHFWEEYLNTKNKKG